MKSKVEKHFDKVAKSYDLGKEKYSYYYDSLKKLLGTLIPEGKKVFEIGCGTGDLLASLNPKIGYGVDISKDMILLAKEKYCNKKNLHFSTNQQLLINNQQYLDFIFMSDVIEHLENPKETFDKIAGLMNEKTIFVNTMANPVWEPLLMVWEKLGLKMPEGPHKRVTFDDLRIMIQDLGMIVTKHDYKLLIPVKIPLITNFANRYLEKYFKKLAFIEYLVAVKS